MDQEISKGTWIGAGLLAIVAILGLAFAVYGIARTLVNNSAADFVNTVDSVGNSSFNDFDGTTVSGLQVRSAIDNYEGDKIAILVNTTAVQQAFRGDDEEVTEAEMTAAYDSDDTFNSTLVRQETLKKTYDLGIVYNKKAYLCYNALFDINSNTQFKDSKEGYLVYEGGFKLHEATSNLKFNTIKTNYKTTGCTEFIANGTNFNAKLIKDNSGTIVGIMFSQVY